MRFYFPAWLAIPPIFIFRYLAGVTQNREKTRVNHQLPKQFTFLAQSKFVLRVVKDLEATCWERARVLSLNPVMVILIKLVMIHPPLFLHNALGRKVLDCRKEFNALPTGLRYVERDVFSAECTM